MTRVERLNAMRAGDHAGRTGLAPSTCPYRLNTPDGKALASAWVRAYHEALPVGPPHVSYDN
jgi:hypothetical protein